MNTCYRRQAERAAEIKRSHARRPAIINTRDKGPIFQKNSNDWVGRAACLLAVARSIGQRAVSPAEQMRAEHGPTHRAHCRSKGTVPLVVRNKAFSACATRLIHNDGVMQVADSRKNRDPNTSGRWIESAFSFRGTGDVCLWPIAMRNRPQEELNKLLLSLTAAVKEFTPWEDFEPK